MKCQEFQDIITKHKTPMEMPRAVVAAVAKHWGTCIPCRKFLRTIKRPWTPEQQQEAMEQAQKIKADPECREILLGKPKTPEEVEDILADMDKELARCALKIARDADVKQVEYITEHFMKEKAQAILEKGGVPEGAAHNLSLIMNLGGMVLTRYMIVAQMEKATKEEQDDQPD